MAVEGFGIWGGAGLRGVVGADVDVEALGGGEDEGGGWFGGGFGDLGVGVVNFCEVWGWVWCGLPSGSACGGRWRGGVA